jgi:hypothetical protein
MPYGVRRQSETTTVLSPEHAKPTIGLNFSVQSKGKRRRFACRRTPKRIQRILRRTDWL